MATSVEFIEFVCEQIAGVGAVRYKKMFGEYMVFVKIKDELKELMSDADKGAPYDGAKEHYILDIENKALAVETAVILEAITPLPKKRK